MAVKEQRSFEGLQATAVADAWSAIADWAGGRSLDVSTA